MSVSPTSINQLDIRNCASHYLNWHSANEAKIRLFFEIYDTRGSLFFDQWDSFAPQALSKFLGIRITAKDLSEKVHPSENKEGVLRQLFSETI